MVGPSAIPHDKPTPLTVSSFTTQGWRTICWIGNDNDKLTAESLHIRISCLHIFQGRSLSWTCYECHSESQTKDDLKHGNGTVQEV